MQCNDVKDRMICDFFDYPSCISILILWRNKEGSNLQYCKSWFFIFSFFTVSCVGTATLCAYSSKKNVPGGPPWGGIDEMQMKGTVQPDNKTIRCLDEDKYKCFAAWSQVHNDVEILWQGKVTQGFLL